MRYTMVPYIFLVGIIPLYHFGLLQTYMARVTLITISASILLLSFTALLLLLKMHNIHAPLPQDTNTSCFTGGQLQVYVNLRRGLK